MVVGELIDMTAEVRAAIADYVTIAHRKRRRSTHLFSMHCRHLHCSHFSREVAPILVLVMCIDEISGRCASKHLGAVCLHDAILRPHLFYEYVRRADESGRVPTENSQINNHATSSLKMEYYRELQDLRFYHALLQGPSVRENYYDFRPYTRQIRHNAHANGLAQAKELIAPERETFTTVAQFVGLAVNFHVTVLSVIACGVFLAQAYGIGVGYALIYGACMGLGILGVEVALLVIRLSREGNTNHVDSETTGLDQKYTP